MTAPLVRLSGVSKYFGPVSALRQIDLEVGQGRMLAVFGPNGSGKTTLLSLLASLTSPTRGQIEYFGEFGQDAGSRRARIGLISHQLMLYGEMTARENLSFFARLYAVEGDRRAEELLQQLGLGDAMDRPVRTFSRGMKQRLAIARALLHEPDLLLLDEPFTGLDQHAAGMLRDLLKGLKNNRRTIVMMTHRLDIGAELADDLAILSLGRLAYYARHDEAVVERFEEVYSRTVAPTGTPQNP
ncbi:MAG: ABC transporter ATP-binding protein [Acidobacteriota bacterium]